MFSCSLIQQHGRAHDSYRDDPTVSRSSALALKATGVFPIANQR